MIEHASGSRRISALLIGGAAVSLLAFHLWGAGFADGYRLDLGSLNAPTHGYLVFVSAWTLFGGLAVTCFALGFSRYLETSTWYGRLSDRWNTLPDSVVIGGACCAALLLPMAIRTWVLRGAPLTDDESAYRFTANLLASGRLWVPSPPMKAFFDQSFMINDGRLYAVYFLGWPALLAVGSWFIATGSVNAVISALTIPPLFLLLRRVTNSRWAALGILLFLSSPFVQIAAATELSHSSCLMALAWSLYFGWRAIEGERPWCYALSGCFLSLAFCIRPQSTVFMAPLLWTAATQLARSTDENRLRAVLAFCAPVAIFATMFLAAQWVENGSAFTVGYARYNQYLIENEFRFSSFQPSDLTPVAGFDFLAPLSALGRTVAGLFRLNFDLFGWPASIVFIGFAWTNSSFTRLLWQILISGLAVLFFQRDWGIDTFGPVHAFELTLPVLALTVVGLREFGHRLDVRPVRQGPSTRPTAVLALAVALVTTAWLGFVPVRMRAVHQVAVHVNLALEAPEAAGVHHAVIFSPLPIAPQCGGVPRHFVFFHPVNDPDLENDILWVNDISVVSNRDLMSHFPSRTGYVLRWNNQCQVTIEPLLAAATGASIRQEHGDGLAVTTPSGNRASLEMRRLGQEHLGTSTRRPFEALRIV